MSPTTAFDPQSVLEIDGYLKPNVSAIASRYDAFKKWKDTIDQYEGGYDNFTRGYDKFGFHVGSGGEVVYEKWVPNAKEAYLIGEFSTWLISGEF
jgi:1,4-alpha-glucan branching enzyme